MNIMEKSEERELEVYELPGEPAVVINGVPSPNSNLNDSVAGPLSTTTDLKLKNNPTFGKSLVGREVRKMFGDHYYFGKVVKFEEETNWYTLVYEDADFEDLEWHELEELLLPLDITMPLKQLALKIYNYDQPISGSGENTAKSSEGHNKALGSKCKAAVVEQRHSVTKSETESTEKDNALNGIMTPEGGKMGRGSPPSFSTTAAKAEKGGRKRPPSSTEIAKAEKSGRPLSSSTKTAEPNNPVQMENTSVDNNMADDKEFHEEFNCIKKRGRGRPPSSSKIAKPEKRGRGRPPSLSSKTAEPNNKVQMENTSVENVMTEDTNTKVQMEYTSVENVMAEYANNKVQMENTLVENFMDEYSNYKVHTENTSVENNMAEDKVFREEFNSTKKRGRGRPLSSSKTAKPEKRGRGRPPCLSSKTAEPNCKVQMENNSVINRMPEDEVFPEEFNCTEKRGRGRPPSSSSNMAKPEKRGRGRPPSSSRKKAESNNPVQMESTSLEIKMAEDEAFTKEFDCTEKRNIDL